MKHFATWMLALVMWVGIAPATASNGHPIGMEDLPEVAHQFLSMHFPNLEIVELERDDDGKYDCDYEVKLSDGTEVEFDLKGEWKEVDCKPRAVPTDIVPRQIVEYVAEHHTGSRIVKISRERDGYEAKLADGLELEFNTRLMFRKAKK